MNLCHAKATPGLITLNTNIETHIYKKQQHDELCCINSPVLIRTLTSTESDILE